MAFVNEFISEADKTRIDFSKIKHPISQRSVTPYRWVIDRERDIVLIPLGGGGECPDIFLMCWHKEIFEVFLNKSFTGHPKTGDYEITWRISKLSAPLHLHNQEILSSLKGALLAEGDGLPEFHSQIKAVHFKF